MTKDVQETFRSSVLKLATERGRHDGFLECEDIAQEHALALLQKECWSQKSIAYILESATFRTHRFILLSALSKRPISEVSVLSISSRMDTRDLTSIISDLPLEEFKYAYSLCCGHRDVDMSYVFSWHAKKDNLDHLIFLASDLCLGNPRDFEVAIMDKKTPHSDPVMRFLLNMFAHRSGGSYDKNQAIGVVGFCLQKNFTHLLKDFFESLHPYPCRSLLFDFLLGEGNQYVYSLLGEVHHLLSKEDTLDIFSMSIQRGRYHVAHALSSYIENNLELDQAFMSALVRFFEADYPLLSIASSRVLLRYSLAVSMEDEVDSDSSRGKRKI